MNILEEMHQQRVRFLRKGYDAPNTVIIPHALRHEFVGAVLDVYRLSPLDPDRLTVMGMRVRYSHETSRIECGLYLLD